MGTHQNSFEVGMSKYLLTHKEKSTEIPAAGMYEYVQNKFPTCKKHLTRFSIIWERFFEPGCVAYDIGAHCGLYAVQMSLVGYKVHAFEGSSRNLENLHTTCEGRNIEIHHVALSDHEEKGHFRFNDCVRGGPKHPSQAIHFRRFDEYANSHQLPVPHLIKMDIEGMETVVLNTMKDYIEVHRPLWQIEYHPGIRGYDHYPGFVPVEQGGYRIEDMLDKHKYMAFNSNLQPTSQFDKHDNYFMVPEEKLCYVRITMT